MFKGRRPRSLAAIVAAAILTGCGIGLVETSQSNPNSFNDPQKTGVTSGSANRTASQERPPLGGQVQIGPTPTGGQLIPTGTSTGAPAAGHSSVSSDGTATYSYPIWVPPGRQAIQPELSIDYDSEARSAFLGLGWSLHGLSNISRCKKDIARDGENSAVTFTSADAFCLDGQRLISVSPSDGNASEFRTEQNGFIRITSKATDAYGPLEFTVFYKDGRIFTYGGGTNATLETERFFTQPQSTGAGIHQSLQHVRYSWALSKVSDRYGNTVEFLYSLSKVLEPPPPSGVQDRNLNAPAIYDEQLPTDIVYTGTEDKSLPPLRSIHLTYDVRPDLTTGYVAGLRVSSRHLLTEIAISAPNPGVASTVKTYRFAYEQSSSTARSLLTSITECDADGVCLLPTSFGYTAAARPEFVQSSVQLSQQSKQLDDLNSQITIADLNGDGCDDIIVASDHIYQHTPISGQDLVTDHAEYHLSSCYAGISNNPNNAFVAPTSDLEQLTPPVASHPSANPPPAAFGPFEGNGLGELGAYDLNSNQLLSVDFDLDGRGDLAWYWVGIKCNGFLGSCVDFTTYSIDYMTSVYLASTQIPSQWREKGDGLFNNANTYKAHSTEPFQLFGPSPGAIEATNYVRLYVADINGDGFPDVIRILNNQISYRLNLGRGRSSPSGSGCLGVLQQSIQSTAAQSVTSVSAEPVADVHICLSDEQSVVAAIPWYGATVVAQDIDGDGTTDLLLLDPNYKSGDPGWYYAFSLTAAGRPRPYFNIGLIRGETYPDVRHDWFADVNGDGLPDCISISKSDGTVWISLNTGSGFGPPIKQPVKGVPADNVLLFDYDGNGTTDIIYSDGSGVHVLLTSNGTIHLAADLVRDDGQPIPGGRGLQKLDLNGDGLTDLVQILGEGPNSSVVAYVRKGGRGDQLQSVRDRGVLSTFEYSPLTSDVYGVSLAPGVRQTANAWVGDKATFVVNHGRWVVSRYAQTRPGSLDPAGLNKFQYNYEDGRVDLLGRGWLGFAKVSRQNVQTGQLQTTFYDNQTRVGTRYPYAKRPYLSVTESADGPQELYHKKEVATKYEVLSGAATYSVMSSQVQISEFEKGTSSGPWLAPYRETTETFGYDQYGNRVGDTFVTSDGYSEVKTFTYDYDQQAWLVSKPKQVESVSKVPTGDVSKRQVRFKTNSQTGVVASLEIAPNGNESLYQKITQDRDQHGQVIKTVTAGRDTADQRSSVTRYDDLEDLLPMAVTNAADQTWLTAYYPPFALPLVVQDPNGQQTRYTYDRFGHLRGTAYPDGHSVNFILPSGSGQVELDVQLSTGEKLSQFSDGSLNEIERSWTTGDGHQVAVLTEYTSEGRIAHMTGPCFIGPSLCAASGSEQFNYDSLNRLISVVHADGTRRTWAYAGRKTTFIDEVGNTSYKVSDDTGGIFKIGIMQPNNTEIDTLYAYGPFQSLKTITDQPGHKVSFDYDDRGRPVAVTEPDWGKHLRKWNTYGELIQATEPDGSRQRFERDRLGRVSVRKTNEGSSTFEWDSAPNGIGKLARATSPDGIKTIFSYDDHGRTLSLAWAFDDKQYRVSFDYDGNGLMKGETYPAPAGHVPFRIQRLFDSVGKLQRVVNAATGEPLWSSEQENARGEVLKETLGKAVSVQRDFDSRARLNSLTWQKSGGTPETLSDEYAANGSLVRRIRSSSLFQLDERFVFDFADRLVTWDMSVSDPTGASKMSPSHVGQEFTYDEIDNLLLRRNTSPDKLTPAVEFHYGENGLGPHVMTSTDVKKFSYDKRGNQVERPGKKIKYNASDLPSHAQTKDGIIVFKYDAFDNLVLKQGSEPGRREVFLGGLYHQIQSGKEITEINYVQAQDRIIGQFVHHGDAGITPLFLVADQLNSTISAISPASKRNLDLFYDPLGQRYTYPFLDRGGESSASPVAIGFAGQRVDSDLSWIDMKGRIYDPESGRFLEPDPIIQDVYQRGSLNPYAYAWNNPLKWVDPSGFDDEPAEGESDYHGIPGWSHVQGGGNEPDVDIGPILADPPSSATQGIGGTADDTSPTGGIPVGSASTATQLLQGGVSYFRQQAAAQQSLLDNVGKLRKDFFLPTKNEILGLMAPFNRSIDSMIADIIEYRLLNNPYPPETVYLGMIPIFGPLSETPMFEVPKFDAVGRTRGVLDTGSAQIELSSGLGRRLDVPMSGRNNTIFQHVEARAAQIMRTGNHSEAWLYINRVPCSGPWGCGANLPTMLPEGATLHVYGPDGYYEPFVGLPDNPLYPAR
jgi:RHS repeat-associated protein